ncbi:MAG: hypothetical protein H6574_00790 [Lewinellaceae bacterium]|nr:hypothetical protein [Saprospiraceae bacterium]MCB9329593.1 hypothetical protein [Lewinellaceae bacterium]
MTQERFIKLLNNPELLATISYEELKTLALTYPYVHNLRYLLAIKAGQDQHPDFTRNLATASAYSLDRTCLFTLMAPLKLAPQVVVIAEKEEILELKPIADVQQQLEYLGPISKSEQRSAEKDNAMAIDFPSKQVAAGPPVLDFTQPDDGKSEMKIKQPEQDSDTPNTKLADLQMPSFNVWISRFNPPILAADVTTDPEKRPLGKVRSEDLQNNEIEDLEQLDQVEVMTPQMLAEKSVTESKSIVSETLAKLYVDQGYTEKAIDMYERLSLAFPDKSAYFAAEIDKLKK